MKPGSRFNDVFAPLGGRNRLLDQLRAADADMIAPYLERVDLTKGQVLFEPGDEVRTVHFPGGRTIVALVVAMENGDTVETASVGREGAVGGIVSQGYLPAFARAVVQIAGPAWRMDAARLQDARARSDTLRDLFTRYADCLVAQLVQSVACNALHPIEERCARWILTIQDRVGGDELPVTQQFLAEMLGVQRTYLSRVLNELGRRGLVTSRRGVLHVHGREALERSACPCYALVRAHYETVLTGTYPSAAEASAAPA